MLKTVTFRHFSFRKEEKHVVAGSTAEMKHSSVRNKDQRSGFFMEEAQSKMRRGQEALEFLKIMQ